MAPTPTPTPHAPTISHLPDGWWLSYQADYGQALMPREEAIGFLKYTSADNRAFVYIEYGGIPDWAMEYTDDIETLLNAFLARSHIFCEESGERYTPDEVGLMTLCSSPAAYARFSLPDIDVYGIAMLCIKDHVMIAVDATWWAEDKESEVMSIIGNISY